MSPAEARSMIEALADGVDPETRETLADARPLNNPRLIRALFVAARALEEKERRDKRERVQPDNAGKSWSDDEDRQLLSAFDDGASVKELSTRHGRTAGAIESRLLRHGRVKEDDGVYRVGG
ncbi:hypothetical protein [Crenobacter cavernae]|uniref:Uncharacterized protein n=1 Tax=Crenobacter cavernae TaxID=2290923 RepID=A0ABY0FAT5_9NEIS|nr:hypothetical protein [Crenobacter cavernae]RXZ42773.1 hypothetical protein EBB06_12850 [Crenobacter cavernae]